MVDLDILTFGTLRPPCKRLVIEGGAEAALVIINTLKFHHLYLYCRENLSVAVVCFLFSELMSLHAASLK